jgi:hypothetical protein
MGHVLFYDKKVNKIVKTNPELAHFHFQKGFISSCLAEHGEVGKAKFKQKLCVSLCLLLSFLIPFKCRLCLA